MIKIEIKISAKNDIDLREYIINKYHITGIQDFRIIKKSIDARNKDDILYVYSVVLQTDKSIEEKLVRKTKNIDLYKDSSYCIPAFNGSNSPKCVIVGMGPSGLFCAYILMKAGIKTLIIERGKNVDERTKDVEKFFKEGTLDISSNVQFGEGGAGTFSDGKLNTAVKDKEGRKDFILNTFYKFGARENILYDSKPHVGTDVLKTIIKNMREELLKNGCEVYFSTKFVKLCTENDTLKSIICLNARNEEIEIECNNLILATGHSARDTFEYLVNELDMEQKPFAVGYRVIHNQKFIDESQYGKNYEDIYENLDTSSYKLTYQTKNENRGVYSFCMCPGGYVVNASSEEKKVCINGMSNADRDSGFSNSAIIVQISPSDLKSDDILAGVEFQRKSEEKAYEQSKGKIPVCPFSDFIKDSSKYNDDLKECNIDPGMTIKGQWEYSSLRGLYPSFIEDSFEEGMYNFEHSIKGFASSNPLLCGLETRTSSPVKMLRNEHFESKIKGVYPCGEGAGYAGGIVSAAMDGMKVAEAIITKSNNRG